MNRIQMLPRTYLGMSLLALLLAASGCASKQQQLAANQKTLGAKVGSLTVSSTAFRNGGAIPKAFTVDGQNASPPLSWSSAPTSAREFVLIVEDPDAPGAKPFVHWLLYDIPPNITTLKQGMSRPGVTPGAATPPGGPLTGEEGKNSKDLMGYVGPEPPPGKTHHYHFQVFALDRPLNLSAGADKQAVVTAMAGHVIAKGTLVGTYQR
jgi:Raf kinase inhibitor-like YbhB/YbcL family protein